jgi:uncharacterized membrane protein YbhN (UPF0104 family)
MKNKHNNNSYARNALALIVILLAFVIILPKLSSFSQSLLTLRNADFVYIGIAILLWASTFFSAALIYKLIALRPIGYGRTLLVQLSSGFTNRLAPLSAGILALNISYLVKRGHSSAQAGAIVAFNNLLGLASTVLLILCLIVFDPQSFNASVTFDLRAHVMWLEIAALIAAVSTFLLIVYGSKLLKTVGKAITLVLQSTLHRPLYLLYALAASIMITVGYAAALYTICISFNAHFSFGQALLVMTFGVLAASVTPTPGGTGGAELGLVVALMAIGITSHQALTVALLYRFLTFWLPILPGFVCFQIVLRKHYI